MSHISLGAWAILTVIVIYDARENRIPNKYVLLLSGYALVSLILQTGSLEALGYSLLGGLLLFVSSLVLYILRVMSAGDVKLLGAVGLLIGYGDLSTATFWILISGAGLGSLYWCLARLYSSASLTDSAISTVGVGGKSLGTLAPPEFREFANTKMPFAPAVAVGLAIYSYLY